jgi:hypothetical protein
MKSLMLFLTMAAVIAISGAAVTPSGRRRKQLLSFH